MWPNSTGIASAACSATSSPDSRANLAIADNGSDTSNFSGGPYTPRISATDSRTCHSRCCSVDVDADCGLAGQPRVLECVGQLLGLVGIGGQSR